MDDVRPFGAELNVLSAHLAIVEVEGEIDIFCASQFKRTLFESVRRDVTRVLVDLTRVTRMDTTALGVLLSAARAIGLRGGSLDVICPREDLRRLLEVSRLDQSMVVYHSSAAALCAIQPRAEGPADPPCSLGGVR